MKLLFISVILTNAGNNFKRGLDFFNSTFSFYRIISGMRPPFWGLLVDTPTRDAETGKSRRFARSRVLGLPDCGEALIVKKLADFRAGKGAKV